MITDKRERRYGTNGSAVVRILLGLSLLLIVAVGGACAYYLYGGGPQGTAKELIIPRGATLKQVTEILVRNGIVDQARPFKLALRFSGGNSKVRAGEFRFWTNMRPIDAIRALYYSEPIIHQITVPEGWTVRQIAERLAIENLANKEKFLELTLNERAAKKFNLPGPSLEGYLFPDTYDISRIDTEEKIVERMVNRFQKVYERELRAEMQGLGMDLLKLVTLASIVEKETGAAEERPLVASVFFNRIQKKMRLQSDPTTIYGIPNFNGNLTKANLLGYSPYNTYVIPGLPPGAICSPGLASLKATLHPATSKYLYFVANNKGHHIFSETYAQHSRNVNTYQK